MNSQSHRALKELVSFGVEELSSTDAHRLLHVVDQCPQCHGEWVLIKRTLTSLSQTGDIPVESTKSHEMWLVCLNHAQKHHS